MPNKLPRLDQPIVGVDWDGTLFELFKYGKLYTVGVPIKEKPIERVVKLIKRLKKKGCFIRIYSSRHSMDCHVLEDALRRYKIPYDDILLGMDRCHLYLNDLAYNPTIIHSERLDDILCDKILERKIYRRR